MNTEIVITLLGMADRSKPGISERGDNTYNSTFNAERSSSLTKHFHIDSIHKNNFYNT